MGTISEMVFGRKTRSEDVRHMTRIARPPRAAAAVLAALLLPLVAPATHAAAAACVAGATSGSRSAASTAAAARGGRAIRVMCLTSSDRVFRPKTISEMVPIRVGAGQCCDTLFQESGAQWPRKHFA